MYKDIKQIIQHSLIYGLGIYLGKAVGFLMIPLYTRALTPADYGILELLNLTSYIIGIIFSMGIATAVYRFYFYYNNNERGEAVSSALIFITILSAFGTILLTIFAKEISGLVFKTPQYAKYLRLIFISTLFDMIVIVPAAYMRALRKSILFNIISLSGLAVALTLNIYLIVFLKMGVRGVLWSGAISSAFICLIYIGYVMKRIKLKFSIQKTKEILKYSYPLMPEAIFIFIIHFSNRYFLQRYLSLREVGIFALGYKFSIILPFLICQPFGLIWSTYKFEMANKENAYNFYSRVITYFFLVTASFCLFLSIFIKEIIYFATSPSFYEAYHIVPIITLGFAFWGLSTAFDMGILLKNKTYFKAIIAALAAIVSLSLNYLLIPKMGILGATIASFCSFFILSLMSLVISLRLYPIPVEWVRLLKISSSAIFIYLLSRLIKINNIYASIALKAFLIPIFILIMFWLKFFHSGEIHKLSHFKNKISFFITGLFIKTYKCPNA